MFLDTQDQKIVAQFQNFLQEFCQVRFHFKAKLANSTPIHPQKQELKFYIVHYTFIVVFVLLLLFSLHTLFSFIFTIRQAAFGVIELITFTCRDM